MKSLQKLRCFGGGSRGRVQGVRPPPLQDDLRFSNTTGILPKKTVWFIGVEVEQETSTPPPNKKSWIRPCAWLRFKTGQVLRSAVMKIS